MYADKLHLWQNISSEMLTLIWILKRSKKRRPMDISYNLWSCTGKAIIVCMNLTFIMERNYSLDDLSALRMIFYARKFEIFYITPMEINATITLNFIQHIELLGSQPWGRAAVDSAWSSPSPLRSTFDATLLNSTKAEKAGVPQSCSSYYLAGKEAQV